VVALLEGDGTVASIADATLEAARTGLELARGDVGLSHSLYLLTQITQAARQEDFAAALAEAGLKVSAAPTTFDLVAAYSEAMDGRLRARAARTDVGEMAQLAACESLSALVAERSQGLFGTTAVEVQRAVRELSTQAGFSALAYDFFSRFFQRFLTYHLGRELSNHVGPKQRFAGPQDHTEFVQALRTHCRESALILRTFAGAWYSKHNFGGGISERKAAGFTAHALTKLRAEFQVRGGRGGE
jgi:hypothetical protein